MAAVATSRAAVFLVFAGLAIGIEARAESGYELWLRYRPVEEPALRESYRQVLERVQVVAAPGTANVIREELTRAAQGMLAANPVFVGEDGHDRSLFIGTLHEPALAREFSAAAPASAGSEGYVIKQITRDGRPCWAVTATSDAGAVFGTFRFLRLLQLRQPLAGIALTEAPAIRRRLLNHWDNLDGTIERGYAGGSLWRWSELPARVDERYRDYARANASLGLNGVVLNNVNADARILRPDYLEKVAALAAVFRPYGMRVYLSANFGAPIKPLASPDRDIKGAGIGPLVTADPLDPAVRAWWRGKVDEIYRLIPDFGGLLVKANSEGMPGPQDYGRTHAEGANLLAEALSPHGGVVMWRAFVYPQAAHPDRASRSFREFAPLDGVFAPNVFVQVKNGPIDFQPHEPFHPLFGAMPRTPQALELQITQEYLGESTHLVFLAPQWQEVLAANTVAPGTNATLAKVVAGKIDGHPDSAIAGVANVGAAENWCGHDFAAANWYAFGRLAWEPTLEPEAIAREWAGQTWTNDPATVDALTHLMLRSWPAAVNYFAPLGLTFTMDSDHYHPGLARRDGQFWRSDRRGLGYDRSSRGSNYIGQYHPSIRPVWDDPRTCPLGDLLFFHVIAWEQPLSTGRSLWEELCHRYRAGVREVEASLVRWQQLRAGIDPERHARVQSKLEAQLAHARRWRDEAIEYFRSRNALPLPPADSRAEGASRPAR